MHGKGNKAYNTSWTKKVSFVGHMKGPLNTTCKFSSTFLFFQDSHTRFFLFLWKNTSILIKSSSAFPLFIFLISVKFSSIVFPLWKHFSTSILKKGFHQSVASCSCKEVGSSCSLLVYNINTKDQKTDHKNSFTLKIFPLKMRVGQHKKAVFRISF